MAGTVRGAPRAASIGGMRLIDSHCHLNADRFDGDLDLVVGGARLAGVERVLVPGWNVASSERALAVVDRFPWTDAAVGVHPHDAAKVDDDGWATIVRWATDPRVVAIGETGLDFDRVFSPIPDQLVNLRRNLRLALDTGKPAILHCRSAAGARDAQDALVDELRTAGLGGPAWAAAFGDRPQAIIHSYSGPADYARIVVDLGLAISFSGLVFRRGEEAAGGRRGHRSRPIGSWSRPTRRSCRRRERRASATSPSGLRSRLAGWRSSAANPRSHSGRPS